MAQKEIIWTTKNGDKMPLKDCGSEHLLNILRSMLRMAAKGLVHQNMKECYKASIAILKERGIPIPERYILESATTKEGWQHQAEKALKPPEIADTAFDPFSEKIRKKVKATKEAAMAPNPRNRGIIIEPLPAADAP